MKTSLITSAYVGMATSPLVVALIGEPKSSSGFLFELGKGFALVALAIICLQIPLAVRIKCIERSVSLNVLMKFHKSMGIFAAATLLFHPLLLAFGGSGLGLLTSLDIPWYILVGKACLITLIVHIVLSLMWRPLNLSFRQWRKIHRSTAAGIIGLGLVHGWQAGSDVAKIPMMVCFAGLVTLVAGSYAYRTFSQPEHAAQDLGKKAS